MLAANELSFWYHASDPPVVYKCSFDLQESEFMAVVGDSGCGKTTLLRLACGLLQFRQQRAEELGYLIHGNIMFNESPITKPHKDFGYVPQNYESTLAPWLSARDNVLLAVSRDGISKDERRHAEELLSMAGILEVAHLNAKKLSGGQQQRVAICRALITRPKVLFMDEPFANLDSALKVGVSRFLEDLRQQFGLALLLVTHDVEAAHDLSDRCMRISRGYGQPEYEWWGKDGKERSIST